MWLRSLCQEPDSAAGAGGDCTICGAWYALDAEDDDFSTFFTRFIAALETVMPASLASVARGITIQQVTPQQYANTLAEACLALPSETVLVLDDYYWITTPEVHNVLAHLVQYASSRLHLVIISRFDPPLPISRLRVQQQLAEVRSEDLQLTESETAKLLELRLASPPSPALASLLQARTEGWIAGVQLAAASLRQESVAQFLESYRRHDSLHVLDFLVDEVLEKTQTEIKDFLLRTALVARFNAELAAEMTGYDLATCRLIIEQLRQQNMFLVILDTQCTWYRYHHQFRAMLLNRAAATLSADVFTCIKKGATRWLLNHGWNDEAFAQLVADEDWQSAADLVEAERHELLNRHDLHRLWRRLQQLPEDVVAQRPSLLLGKAWILQFHNRDVAQIVMVEQAAALLSAGTFVVTAPPISVLWGEINLLRAAKLIVDMLLEQRLEVIQKVLPVFSPAQNYQWVKGYAFMALAYVMLGLGQRDAAYRQIMREIGAADFGSGRYLLRLHHALGILAHLDGTLNELWQISTRYQELAVQIDVPFAEAWARYGLAWSQYHDAKPSHEVLETLLPVFDRLQVVHLNAVLLMLPLLVAAAVELGRLDAATQALDKARRVAFERENLFALDQISASSALYALYTHDRNTALSWAADFLAFRTGALAESTDISSWAGQVFVCARIVVTWGTKAQVQETIRSLQIVVDSARGHGYLVEVLEGAVLLACCYWRSDQPVKALEWMQQALALGIPRGYRRVFFDQGADAIKMLQTLAQRGVCAEAVAKLLAEYADWSSSRQGPQPPVRKAADAGVLQLTQREEEVLLLLAQQLSNKEIARRLNISGITVRNHTSSIYSKLNVTSRKTAVARAKALQLLP